MRGLIACSAVMFGIGIVAVPSANADSIPGLFTTGVDAFGNVLSLGVEDPHYTVLEAGGANSFTMSAIPASFIPNDATSLWTWENANGLPANVTRTFRTTFDLTGLDPATALISGEWATDNFGLDILINGISTSNTAPGFTSFTTFNIDTGFVEGLNTLDFVVQDVGNISGFRVGSISGTAATVPEPSSLLGLLAFGAFGAGSRLKRKQQSRDKQ